MKKSVIVIVAVLLVTSRNLFADVQSRTNGIELLQGLGCIGSVSSTPTNLIVMFKAGGFNVGNDGKTRGTAEYAENNEALILTPDKETSIFEHHANVRFTPVSFKNEEKGFRIIMEFNASSFGHGVERNIAYVALGDTPIPMSASDVEMIMDGEQNRFAFLSSHAKWKKFNRETSIQPSSIYRKAVPPEPPPEPPAVTPPEQIETPDKITEDEQDEEKNKASKFWLCVVIFHCLLAILWLARKKRKRETKN